MFAMTKLTGIFGPKMASEVISQRLILAVVCLQHLRLWPHHFHIGLLRFHTVRLDPSYENNFWY